MRSLLLSFLLTACAHTAFKTVDNVPLRSCSSSYSNIYTSDFSMEDRKAVGSSSEYWNEAVEMLLFSYDGNAPQTKMPITSVMVYQMDDDGKLSSRQITVSKSRKCVVGANIYIRRQAFRYRDMLQTLLRKELGFVLGLDASADFTDLMYVGYEPTLQNPVEATNETINAIRSVYSSVRD